MCLIQVYLRHDASHPEGVSTQFVPRTHSLGFPAGLLNQQRVEGLCGSCNRTNAGSRVALITMHNHCQSTVKECLSAHLPLFLFSIHGFRAFEANALTEPLQHNSLWTLPIDILIRGSY